MSDEGDLGDLAASRELTEAISVLLPFIDGSALGIDEQSVRDAVDDVRGVRYFASDSRVSARPPLG